MENSVFIDANIFLEVFLGDSKSEKCEAFLESLPGNGIIPVTTDFIIYSCLIVAQNNLKSNKGIRDLIVFFNSLRGLVVLRPSFSDLYKASEIMSSSNLDFDDSLVVACIKNYEIAELASLDKDFDKIKGIKRAIL